MALDLRTALALLSQGEAGGYREHEGVKEQRERSDYLFPKVRCTFCTVVIQLGLWEVNLAKERLSCGRGRCSEPSQRNAHSVLAAVPPDR